MKKYINYIGLAILCTSLFSCSKEPIVDDGQYVGSSKITVFPIITVTGEPYIYVPKGGTYTDPGATAKAGSANVTVVASGLPNTGVAGVYTETYTATNTDGFAATGTRTVVVYSTDVTATANDFSGKYARSTNGSLAEWTKVAPGVYKVFNPGGAPGTNLTVIMFNQTSNKVFIPSQIAGGSLTSSSTESSSPLGGPALTGYSMVIINPGYATSVRAFVKQ